MEAIKTVDLKNTLVNQLGEYSALLAESAISVADGAQKVNSARMNLDESIKALNESIVADYVLTHSFHDIIMDEYIPVFSLQLEEDGSITLADDMKKVTVKALAHHLPFGTSEKIEAFGRIAAYQKAQENPALYGNPAAFIETKVSEKTCKPSKREQKVQEYIASLRNSVGGFSVKDMKLAMHNFIFEISMKGTSVFITSGLYQDFCDLAIRRGKNWGERTSQPASVYEDMFLEYVHMVLAGKKKMTIVK